MTQREQKRVRKVVKRVSLSADVIDKVKQAEEQLAVKEQRERGGIPGFPPGHPIYGMKAAERQREILSKAGGKEKTSKESPKKGSKKNSEDLTEKYTEVISAVYSTSESVDGELRKLHDAVNVAIEVMEKVPAARVRLMRFQRMLLGFHTSMRETIVPLSRFKYDHGEGI